MKQEYIAIAKLVYARYKRLSLALVVLCYTTCLYAQDKELPYIATHPVEAAYVKATKYDYGQIYSTNHWNFLLRPLVYPGTDLHFSHPLITMRLVASPGFQLGWMYQINIRRRWGIQLGLSVEAGWLQYTYSIKKAYYTGLRMDDGQSISASSFWDNFGYNLPVSAEYHLPLYDKRNSWLMNFKIGAELKFASSANTEGSYNAVTDSAGRFLKTFAIDKYGVRERFFANFHASVGFTFILPNKKLLNFAILGSYCPFFRDYGTLTFFPDIPSRTILVPFTKRYDYIGFELNYVFTRPRHMRPAEDGYRGRACF